MKLNTILTKSHEIVFSRVGKQSDQPLVGGQTVGQFNWSPVTGLASD